jgi:hypothetical protein
MKHSNGTTEDLVNDIGNLRYDELSKLLFLLSNKIYEDGRKDYFNNREKLGLRLGSVAGDIHNIVRKLEDIWDICKNKE